MSKTKKRPEKGSWQASLNDFLETSLADRASAGLSERAAVAVHVDGSTVLIRRRKGKLFSVPVDSEDEISADVEFWVPPTSLRHLLNLGLLPGTGLGTMGVAVFESILASDPERKIRFKLKTGFMGLWGGGYFSVLKSGGPEVASYLTRIGLSSFSQWKDVMRKFRE